MAVIKVRTNSIKRVSAEIREASIAISNADKSIEGAIRSLAGSTSADRKISKTLNDVRIIVKDSARSASKMGETLEAIANHYELTDKRIVLQSLNVKKAIDANSSKGKFDLIIDLLPGFIVNFKWLSLLGAATGAHQGGTALGAGLFIIPGTLMKPEVYESLEILKTKFSTKSELSLIGKDGKFDPKIEASAKAEFVALAAKTGYDMGLISGCLEGEVGKVSAKGKATASLFDENGNLSPELEAKAVAEATLMEGKYTTEIGNDDINAKVEADGKLLTAKAEASASVSDEGFEVKAGAEAYAAKGEAKTELNFFGLKVELTAGGGVGGASATAEGKVTGTSVSGKIGLGLGLGVDLGLNVSWDKQQNVATASSAGSGSKGKGSSGGGGGGGGGSGR